MASIWQHISSHGKVDVFHRCDSFAEMVALASKHDDCCQADRSKRQYRFINRFPWGMPVVGFFCISPADDKEKQPCYTGWVVNMNLAPDRDGPVAQLFIEDGERLLAFMKAVEQGEVPP